MSWAREWGWEKEWTDGAGHLGNQKILEPVAQGYIVLWMVRPA